MRPTVAITLGDPAGVGPEIVARVCHDPEVITQAELLVVGAAEHLAAGAAAAGVDMPQVDVAPAGPGGEIPFGAPSAKSGAAAGAAVESALALVRQGQAQAMATAPISKEALKAAGYPDTGHTTLLARLTNTENPVMMLAGHTLRVVLVTIHCALAQVFLRISQPAIVQVAKTTNDSLSKYFGLAKPRLAVAALNPHAGESGLFGLEEQEIITPAIQEMQKMGIDASGPHPPDTVFWAASKGKYDAVVCMYHDQGLIPLKLLHFEDGVNVTLGLPIIRTSVDHGTAYDIAGQGKANPASLKQAVLLAADMARRAEAGEGRA